MSEVDPPPLLSQLEAAVKADPDNKLLRQALDAYRSAVPIEVAEEEGGPPRFVMNEAYLNAEVGASVLVHNGFGERYGKVTQLLQINHCRAWRVLVGDQELVVRHPDEAWQSSFLPACDEPSD